MSTAPSPLRRTGRLEWVDGSALARRDLRDAVAAEEAMLALHMRGVHEAHGVGLGLAVLLAADHRSVLVTPGFAITCLGEAILLPSSRTLAAPPDDGAGTSAWDLVLEAPAAHDGCARRDESACGPAPSRTAVLRWRRADALPRERERSTAVVLARHARLAAGLLGAPDLSVRRGVAVLERPHVAGGTLPAAGLAWRASGGRLRATIDTTAAGFSRPAIYHVRVVSHPPWPAAVVGAFLSVATARRASADVQLVIAGAPSAAAALALARGISVGWLGIEPARGCPPAFTAAQVVAMLATPAHLQLWATALAAVPGFRP